MQLKAFSSLKVPIGPRAFALKSLGTIKDYSLLAELLIIKKETLI
jgi:hypothetical protein